MLKVKQQAGVTLIELIISIVIIGIASAAILGVYTNVIRASADPMIRAQAIAIAEAYMDEIIANPLVGSASSGDPRQDLDNVPAYNGLSDTGANNALGDSISGLQNYTVDVTVSSSGDLNVSPAYRIDVQVQDDANTVDITLTAWRSGE